MGYPRFQLRDVFWLTLVIAIVLAAAVWQRRDAKTAGRYQQLLDKNGNHVTFDTATGERWVDYGRGTTPVYHPPAWEQTGR
jgi:hypothetical protein